MKLKYTVSEADYISFLRGQFKRRRNRPLALILFLLSTAGQTALAVYCLASGLARGTGAALMALLSVGLTALSIFNRQACGQRARGYYAMLKRAGKVPANLSQRCVLTIDNDEVSIEANGAARAYPASDIAVEDYDADGLGLFCQGRMAAILPESAFASPEQRAQYLSALRDAALRCDIKTPEEIEASIPDAPFARLDYAYTKKDYVSHQIKAYRGIFKTPLGWPPITIALLLLSAGVVCFAAVKGISAFGWVCAVMLAALMNMHYIRIFSPLIKRRILKTIPPLLARFPDRAVKCYFGGESIVIAGSQFALSFPRDQIKAARNFGDFMALYINQSLILTIPRPKTCSEAEFSAIFSRLSNSASA